jgi:hypothetical protein
MNNPNRSKIIEAYMVPAGNVSPDIFKLPCVVGAIKTRGGNTDYTVVNGYFQGREVAGYCDYICKSDDGKWFVLSAEEYHEYNLNL